jgi:transcriptional regulator with XRE-family HTH domain
MRRGKISRKAPSSSDMERGIQSLALTIQRLREQRGLTIEDLAKRAGVSPATVSQLERNHGNPSFSTLLKMAGALGVPLPVFFQSDRADNSIVVRARHRKRLMIKKHGGRVYELLSPDVQGAIEMLWVELQPGVWTEDEPLVHRGEECLVVLKGRLEAHIGKQECHLLEVGDSIYVRGKVPHSYRNVNKGRTVLVAAITPPSF